jgi:hypothetical protein
MGCNCNNNQSSFPKNNEVKIPNRPSDTVKTSVISNLIEAGKTQENKLQWVTKGVNGILKSLTGETIYSDDDIQKNRDYCRNCQYSTKKDGKLTNFSQCMAPDPQKDGAKCGCFIEHKTRTDICPLKIWKTVPLTINKK